jgi:hypothetical protein
LHGCEAREGNYGMAIRARPRERVEGRVLVIECSQRVGIPVCWS